MCLNQEGDFIDAIYHCSLAIDISSTSAKAYYIKSQAYSKQQEWEQAITALKACIMLQPNDRKLRTELEKLQKENKKANQSFGEKISNFISGGIYNEKKTNLKKQRRKVVHERLPKFDPGHIQCFFEISIGHNNEENRESGRVVFELFDHDVPETCENFRALCTGERGANLWYQDTRIHRIVRGFMMAGGDNSQRRNGEGGISIYGPNDPIHSKDGFFDDENIWFPHSHKGVISMLPRSDGKDVQKNTNGSQFVISLREDNQYFDETSTVFGRIIHGLDFVLTTLQSCDIQEEKPVRPLIVTACGELKFEDKLTEEQAVDLPNYIVTPEMEAQIAKMHEYRRRAQEKYQKELEERKQRELERKEKEKAEAEEAAKAKAEGRELPKKEETKKEPEETATTSDSKRQYQSRRDVVYDDDNSEDSEDDKIPRVLKSDLEKKKKEKKKEVPAFDPRADETYVEEIE